MMSDSLNVSASLRSEKTNTETTTCPVCHVALNKKNLSKHARKVHGQALSSHTGRPAGSRLTSSLADSYEEKRRKEFISAQSKPRAGKVNNNARKLVNHVSDNSGKVQVNKKYYKCWQCGKLLTKASTANHLLKKHGVRPKDPDTAYFWYFDEVIKVQYRDKPAVSPSATKPKKKEEVDWQQEIFRLSKFNQSNRKNTTVTCPVCNASLNARNVKKHFNKVHKELLKMKKPPNSASSYEDKSVSVKKKTLDVRPDFEYSEDVFDRAKVYQGGAYGLGKSRKH